MVMILMFIVIALTACSQTYLKNKPLITTTDNGDKFLVLDSTDEYKLRTARFEDIFDIWDTGGTGGTGSDTMLVASGDTVLLNDNGVRIAADSIRFPRLANAYYQWLYIKPNTGTLGADSIVQPAGFMLKMEIGSARRDLQDQQDGEIRWWYVQNDTVKEVYGYPKEPLPSVVNHMFMGRIERNLMYIAELEFHSMLQYIHLFILYVLWIAMFIYIRKKL